MAEQEFTDRRVSMETLLQDNANQERRRGDRRRNNRREYSGSNVLGDLPPLPIRKWLFSASEGLTIRTKIKPGDIGWLIWLHGVLYAREHGWNYSFEAYVAGPLSEYALRNDSRECLWIVECIDRIGLALEGKEKITESVGEGDEYSPSETDYPPPDAYPSIVGSIGVVASSPEEAQIRWLFLTPELRGKGMGRKLLKKALSFCREAGYQNVVLWSTSDLDEAGKLYKSAGFEVTEEVTHDIWGKVVTELKWEMEL